MHLDFVAEPEVLGKHPIDTVLQLLQVADVEVIRRLTQLLHASGEVFEMREKGEVGKLDLLRERAVWLGGWVTHTGIVIKGVPFSGT